MGAAVTFTSKPGLVEAAGAAGLSLYFHQDNRAGTARWETDGDVTAVNAFIASYDPLSYNKAQKLAALEDKFNEIINGGRLYSVVGGVDTTQHKYQIDEVPPSDPVTGQQTRRASQDTITSMGSQAKAVIDATPGVAPWSTQFAWMDADNRPVPMMATQCFAFTQNVAVYVETVDANYFALKGAIAAAADQAALDAVDVTAGWPANP